MQAAPRCAGSRKQDWSFARSACTSIDASCPVLKSKSSSGGYMLKKTYWIPAAAAALVISLYAQAPQGGGQGKGGGKGGPPAGQMIQQLKPNFYVVTGDGGNTGVRVTDAGLIIVDTKNLGDQFY